MMDFPTPSGYAAAVVDSVEEMFSVDKRRMESALENGNDNSVKLVFPLTMGEVDLDIQWPWNVCGGLRYHLHFLARLFLRGL
jgi:hypothetical protein